MGYSSVAVTSTRASIFGGVSRSKSFKSPSGEAHYRPAGGQIVGNEVSPENAMTETGPERLGAGFLGCETLCWPPAGSGASENALLLVRRQNSLGETIAELIKDRFDPPDVGNIRANAQNHRIILPGRGPRSSGGAFP